MTFYIPTSSQMIRGLLLIAICAIQLSCDTSLSPKTKGGEHFPSAPVRIVYDSHGIAHVYAQNDPDVFYGQGYVTASQRPAQMELTRFQALGRSAELLGEDAYQMDLFLRAMGFQRWAERHWTEFEQKWPWHAQSFAAFVAGVNARYAEYRKDGWPATVRALGVVPEDWDIIDSFAVSQLLGYGLAGAAEGELFLSGAMLLLGPDMFDDIFRLAPGEEAFTLPNWYEDLGLSPGGKTFIPAAVQESVVPSLSLRLGMDRETVGKALNKAAKAIGAIQRFAASGSNNFALSGKYTASGSPIVESDTHQGTPTPTVYQQMHLVSRRSGATGSQDMIGATFPGAPSVVFGHNGKLVWTPTIQFTDLSDYYLERILPGQDRVARPNGSLPFTRHMENVKIRLADGSLADNPVEFRDIPGHGPILPRAFLGVPGPIDISVRWTGSELPGPTVSVADLSKTETFDQVQDALRYFKGATISFVVGATNGDIGFSSWTQVPDRVRDPIWKPWFLMPADRVAPWKGSLSLDKVPYVKNPKRGYVWTANNDPVGNTLDGDPGNDPYYYGFAYAPGYRGKRLDDRLTEMTAAGGITMGEMMNLQHDRKSTFAARLLPYLGKAAIRSPGLVAAGLQPVIDALLAWDLRADADRYEPTIFYSWAAMVAWDMFLDEMSLVDTIGGTEMFILSRSLTHWLDQTDAIIDQIEAGTLPFPSKTGRNYFDNLKTRNKIETRDEILLNALSKVVDQLRASFVSGSNGTPVSNPSDFRNWALNKKVYFRTRHLLADVDSSWEKYDQYFGVGGGFDTVAVGHYPIVKDGKLLDQYIIDNASSNRYLYEMLPSGVQSWFQLPGGQDEDPDSAHYMDLMPDYQNLKHRKFPYTDAEIEAAQESVVELR